MTDYELILAAMKARETSYSPYSHFAVGAALLCADGTLYQGCNIENAAYTPGNCAERTAIFKAVSEGKRDFSAIAVVGGLADNSGGEDICAPCGVCRQVMREFFSKSTRILLAPLKAPEKITSLTLSDLLPMSFGPEDLER